MCFSLTNISSCYSSILGVENLTEPYPLITLTASHRGTESALPADWQFLPIVRLYNCERYISLYLVLGTNQAIPMHC